MHDDSPRNPRASRMPAEFPRNRGADVCASPRRPDSLCMPRRRGQDPDSLACPPPLRRLGAAMKQLWGALLAVTFAVGCASGGDPADTSGGDDGGGSGDDASVDGSTGDGGADSSVAREAGRDSGTRDDATSMADVAPTEDSSDD